MTHISLQHKLIAILNQIALIPLPLAKFTLKQWLLNLQNKENQYRHNSITKIFKNQHILVDHRVVTSTLQYLFKIFKKADLTTKHVNILLKQNTLLSDQHSQIIISLYQSYLQNDGSGQIKENGFNSIQWSAISLRQTEDLQQPNKLYMKVELSSQSKQYEKKKTVTMTLLEFKLFIQQINKVQSIISA